MDDPVGWTKDIGIGIAGYPLYLARTLIQIGYEPVPPNQNGLLPNVFSYIAIIKEQRGYLALYTGIGYYLPALIIKKSINHLTCADHQKELTNREKRGPEASKIIADCLYESAIRIYSTILTYPLVTLGIGYISTTFFGSKESVDFTLESSYRGIIPKLIIEVIMVWVTIVSKRLTMSLVEDELAQAIATRVPPFIVQTFLYPLSVVSTVMADNGNSRLNPKFNNWAQCFQYLRANNQLKRGSSLFYRRAQLPTRANYPRTTFSIANF